MSEVIKLDFPVTHDEKMVSEITMRRPTVRDHIWLEHQETAKKRENKVLDDVEKDAMLYARLADAPVEVIYKLDMSDWGKCRMFYLGCINPSKSSSQKTETDSSTN